MSSSTRTQVSPLPWVVASSLGVDNTVLDANGEELCVMYETDGADDAIDLPAQANAEFIVRCVNVHAELLAALKEMLDTYLDLANSGDCGHWNPEKEAEVIRARAALAKAEAQ